MTANFKLNEKFKNLVKSRNQSVKYHRFDKKMTDIKKKSFSKIIVHLFQRFITIVARFLFKNVIYGEKGQHVPPVKNLLLLEPASVLAMKIRTRKVSSVEVMKAFIERIQVS